MEKESLGPFEIRVLTATYLLGGKGYSVTITDKVNEMSPKRVLLGAVYVSLDRLQSRGLVASWFSEPTSERGGKSRRYFKVTPAGERALAQAKASAQLWLEALGELI
jgi:DNA-binding PadR family transcriptional regulator